jgi:hypothetical protein
VGAEANAEVEGLIKRTQQSKKVRLSIHSKAGFSVRSLQSHLNRLLARHGTAFGGQRLKHRLTQLLARELNVSIEFSPIERWSSIAGCFKQRLRRAVQPGGAFGPARSGSHRG